MAVVFLQALTFRVEIITDESDLPVRRMRNFIGMRKRNKMITSVRIKTYLWIGSQHYENYGVL